jgi:biotin transport system substrate-specific component
MQTALVYADLWRPRQHGWAFLYDIALIGAASFGLGLLAQVALPLPWTPVPITGQTLGVLLIGALLGCWRGSATILAYLAEGAAGLPVFAQGTSGVLRLLGPTGGYLVGFVLAAFVVGWLAERGWDRNPWTTAAAMAVGNACIYACGLPWLAHFVGWDSVLAAGLLPFLPGDGLKLVLATLLLPTLWRFTLRPRL